jgi:hypothetical protein
MATMTITITTAHAQRVRDAMDFENGNPPGTATAEDARQLLIQHLKDYTLWAERSKYLSESTITEITPT